MAFTSLRGLWNVVSIPLKNAGGGDVDNNVQEQECIEIRSSELPPSDDVITLLRNEDANADTWHRVALLYYSNGDSKSFLQIADEGYREKQAQHNSDVKEESVVPLLLSLGAFFYMMASVNEGDKSAMEKHLAKTANCYNRAFALGVNGFEAEYYVGRAYAYLLTGEIEHAEKHFSFVLSSLNASFLPAIVGKALIAYDKMDYTTALQFFRQALRLDPNSAANVRVGIGHCFWKLNQREKAKIAYERAVELYPNDYYALCALATYHLSTMDHEQIVPGVKLLARAHSICPSHPGTQLLLADHYYYKRDFDKALNIALDVCKNAGADDMRKRSAYLAGRCYQAKGDFKYAMHYYYQALSEPDTGFCLPYFGLAQSYLNFNDIPHCTEILQKLLLQEPNNYFAMKILGTLESTSEDCEARKRAQKHLKAVLDHDPDDVWTKISLATSLECLDDNRAREYYVQVLEALKSRNAEVDPEIHNNLACTLFRLKQFAEAEEHFEIALDLLHLYVENRTDYRPMMTTLNFNMARTKEALHKYQTAETIYKEILKKHPSYFSCFIRLAVIYRDRNNLHEADAYFKEALQCSREHPDIWAYIGNMHLAQGETLPAQKKFLRILKMKESTKRDSYSMIALGNVEMSKLFSCLYDSTTKIEFQLGDVRNYMKQSVEYFQAVLQREPENIWAANGLGCIFAAKGLFTDAREVFSRVREAAHDFKDVWMNIGHTYLEQELFFNAIQMYERCDKRFSVNTNIKLLQCMAKAFYYNKSFKEAKIALLKCRRVAPYDSTILFALAKTLRKIGWLPFQAQSGSPDLKATLEGLGHLKQAKKFFEYLSTKQSNSSFLISAASIEERHCDDLIRQTPHMISRIEADFKREQSLKNKREREIRDFKEKQRREQDWIDQRKRKHDEEAQKQREAVKVKVEKVKQTLELAAVSESRKRERKMKKEKDKEELIDHSSVNDEDYDEDSYLISKTLTPPPSAAARKPKGKKKKTKREIESVAVVNLGVEESSPKDSRSPIMIEGKLDHTDEDAFSAVKIGGGCGGEVQKPSAKKNMIFSPDITSFARKAPVPEPFPESKELDTVENWNEDKKEALSMKEEDAIVFMDILTAADDNSHDHLQEIDDKDQEDKQGEKMNSGESPSSIYDDLLPPNLCIASESPFRQYSEGTSSPPPVLHSFYSDDENH